MLVLTRKKDTVVYIGESLTVTVRDFFADGVVVQVDFPTGLAVTMAGHEVVGEPAPGGATAAGEVAPGRPPGLRASLPMRLEEAFTIGEEVLVKVVSLVRRAGVPYRVRLGFQAPKELRITRGDQRPEAADAEGE